MSGTINEKVDTLLLKPSCLRDACFVEGENSPCKASCLKNVKICHDDIHLLKSISVDRFSDSVTELHYTNASESSSLDRTKEEEISTDCRTPDEHKFDPFATGPDELMLAPKKIKGSHLSIPKALSCALRFDLEESVETDSVEDPNTDFFSNLIFSSLLELIISTKLMEIAVSNQEADSDQTEECNTPTTLPFLTGFAETCPPAPKRSTLFLKRFDHSICRRLDFESCLN